MKPRVHIENWELDLGVLWGAVQDHPHFDKGERVKTSSIVQKPRNPKQGDEIETRNTIYILGKPANPPKRKGKSNEPI